MSSPLTCISGGRVYDPAHGVDGVVREIWLKDGRIVAPPSDGHATYRLDARGLIVMPGGVDMHCHIAGPKVNAGRKMRPDQKRDAEPLLRTSQTHSGTLGSVPSTFATGYKYAGLGYTTAFDAAIPPLAARHVHEEFEDTPCIDKGFFVLVGNNEFVLQAIKDNNPERLRAFLAWLTGATKAYALKAVNPGGVESWKQKQAGNVQDLDTVIDYFDITPRQIIQQLARAANTIGFPHPLHIHCNNLGLPGNWTTTLETMRVVEDQRAHFTHIQFHSYGGGGTDEGGFRSQVAALSDYVNSHPNITVDVGQILFGDTTSMTGDGPLGYYLQKVFGTKWFSADTELESGCGIAPIRYKNTNLVHAWQWAIGLEWFLLVQNPWQIALSTDHPNGGSFLSYPAIIKLLMDKHHRRAVLATCHASVQNGSVLKDLDREYTLNEICIITRAAPARMLGLPNKGHLGVGADADITLYDPHPDLEQMFSLPKYVFKAGQLLIENTELRTPTNGKTLYVAPEYDPAIEQELAAWFARYSTVQFRNYPVSRDYVPHSERVAVRLPS
ncbi:MAG TPA: formylmethanofuran dehydrogenase subunit A [Pirellulaceae bacterium]|nr:formylmethanofuran dehydrogenase subunit A [Pirellulaceae bacterium]